MRKLSVIVIVLVLLIAGVAGAQVTVGGILELRARTDFEDNHRGWGGDTRITVDATVDEYNTLSFRLPASLGEPTGIERNLLVDRAFGTTDVGALLGTDDAGLGVTVIWGLNEWAYADFIKLGGYELEQIRIAKPLRLGGRLNLRIVDTVNVYMMTGLDADDLDELETFIVGLDTALDVGVGTLSAEVVYGNNNRTLDEGAIGVGAKLTGIALSPDLTMGVGGSATYHLEEGALAGGTTGDLEYGAGVSLDFAAMGGFGAGLYGTSEDAADSLGVNVRLTPVDSVRFDVGTTIGLAERFENAFDSLDASTTLSVGRAEFRIGYLYIDEENLGLGVRPPKRDLRASENNQDGLYLRARLSF